MKIALPTNWKYIAGLSPLSEAKVPAGACPRCGGWHGSGGMSQHSKSKKKVLGRKGCICNSGLTKSGKAATAAEIAAAKKENEGGK